VTPTPDYKNFSKCQRFAVIPPPCCRHFLPLSTHWLNQEGHAMHRNLIAVAAAAGLLTVGAISASAAPSTPTDGIVQAKLVEGPGPLVQQADWYCGPRCQYWHHRRWERNERRREYRYGYNGYGYRGYNGGYGSYYR
jgi:hypothetical protein